jgi:hypothetical protein
MATKAKGAGRPPADTPSVDELIIEYLRRNDGSAEWRQLKNARKTRKPISESALKAAIDRLIKREKLIKRAEMRNGKAATLYCLLNPIPEKRAKEGSMDFLQWVDCFVDQIEKAHQEDIELDTGKMANTFYAQRYALSLLINFLGATVLDELKIYSRKENDDDASRYLDITIRTDLAVLIKNLAKLTSPRYGDATQAIEDVQEQLHETPPLDI